MSAFGKPPPPHLHGFDTNRSFSDSPFVYTNAPQHASQPPPNPPLFQNASQMTQINYGSHARGPYDEQPGSYSNFNSNSTSSIRVTSRQPSRGSAGMKFDVCISSSYDIMTTSLEAVSLMFGPHKCQASVSRYNQQGRQYQYVVSTEVPHLAMAEWESSEIPVFLLVGNGEGELVEKLDVGPFTYDDEMLKRNKIGGDLEGSERSQSLNLKAQEDYSPYSYIHGEPYSPPIQFNSYEGLPPQYGRNNSVYQPSPSARPMYQYSTSSSSSAIKAPSSQVSGWNNNYRNNNGQVNQGQGSSGLTSVGRTSLPSISPHPRLVRTSTLDQARNIGGASITQAGQAFYHQAMHPLTVVLNFQSDLDSVGRLSTWSRAELQARRRILHFKRTQTGNTISIKLKPVSPEERQPQSICISCILWEEKTQCFVTSVDTIYLLEHIMAQKFPTEEKNRIRRNLEHFKPLTVKKPVPDKYDETNPFFTAIMGFPQPKPRNIEKDIKIFAWKSLSSALKKITSKYSVSAASVLPSAPLPPPALLTPASSTGYGGDSTATYSVINERNGMFSPRSSTRSISGASASNVGSAFAVQSRLSSPPYTHLNPIKPDLSQPGAAPDLRGAVAMPSFPEHAQQWPPATHHMPAPHYTPRASWDLTAAPYPDGGGSAGGPGSAQPGVIHQHHQQPLSPILNRRAHADLNVALADEQGAKQNHQDASQHLRAG